MPTDDDPMVAGIRGGIMNSTTAARRRGVIAVVATLSAIGALLVALPQAAAAGPTTVTQTFSYTGSTSTFTVPSGISALTLTIVGAEGGNGGADATPAPPPGGYRGVVTGTIAVTPGQQLTVAVGSHGATGPSQRNSGNASRPVGGSNPLSAYQGGLGGAAGANGSSGFGGAGGAASVVRVSGSDVVAAGGGGNGGSGQYASTQGHDATSTYTGRTDVTTTKGQDGINANDICSATSCSNNDGGGSGGGGGGAQGGAQGDIQFGAGTSNEWYGFGGSVGQNSTAALPGLSTSYQYYSDNVTDGSVVISYTTGSPAAPTALSGTAGNGSVNLIWTAPTDPGQSAISDYLVQYSSNGGSSWSVPVDLGSTDTAGTVTGLSNGTAYIFQVAAVNSVGTGVYSSSSPSVTPVGPPSAPTIGLVAAQDGALAFTVTAPGSGAAVTGYDYRVDGGPWVTVASPSTSLVIPGLINGTSYSIEVRAESTVGPGAISAPSSGTPQAVPGAPTITALGVGNGSVDVSFTPGFNGGGAVTSYQYRLNGGAWTTASGTSSPITIGGLGSGVSYAIELRAVNSAGPGAASTPANAATPGAPGAPSVSSVTAGDGTATVVFTPGTTGGAPIDSYQYQTTVGGAWSPVAATSSPIVISGLTNGTGYSVSIRAVNAVGTGPASAPVDVTPATIPGAPTIVGDTVAGSNAQLSAAFTAPNSDGGATIAGYQYSTDGGATWRNRADGRGTASPLVITALSSDGATALVNGTTYYVELRAVNAVGAGTASAVAVGIATTTPSAPVITHVSAVPTALAVEFTPAANGGSTITSYEYSLDGGHSWSSTGTLGTSFTITGLINGTGYPVQVRASNSVGDGAASAAVNGTPVDLPGQAVIHSVVRSDRTLTASVVVTDDGGSPITAWQYSTDGGATWATVSGTASPLALTVQSSDGTTRLSNGTGYALAVRAVTAIGTGPASATTTVAPASAPAAPAIALTAGDARVTVAFTLGADGGSPVDRIEYTLDAGSHWIDPGTLSSPFTITGLGNGTGYGVQLRAHNAIGAGAASVTASTTPRTVPGAPAAVSATSNSASADVAWSAPSSTGGAAISGYTATAYASGTATTAISSCTTSGALLCTIPGLSNNTAYYVAVSAGNVAGTGAESAPRVLVTPLARPAAPTLTGLTMGDGSIGVAFTAGSSGDRAISSYQYSVDGGSTWAAASGTSSPILITGLTDGTRYTVALRAVSAAGTGVASNTLNGTPYTYPSAPDVSTIVANGGNGQITVSWAAANLNGGTLQNYTATAFTGLTSGSTAATCTTTGLSCVITGLSNGTTYYVSLQTQNTAAMYSVRSAPRVPATPSLQPGAPTAVTAVAGDAQATVSWTAPTSTGASAITGYTVWYSVGGGSYSQVASVTSTSTVLTGLTNGSAYTFEVFAINGNGTGPASSPSSSVTPLAPGTVPTLSSASSTASGFTSSITNFAAGTSYSATANNGATVTLSGATITVTGLSNGAASHVTVTATKAGQTTTSAALDGTALLAGIAPTFSGNVATSTGFVFTITNYDAAATYALSASGGASATRSGATVTVTGLPLGGSSSVTVVASKAGSTTVSAIDAGAAMVSGTAPTFTGLVSTGSGFQFRIANYDAGLSYELGATGGAVVGRSGDTVTVTGLIDGASSDVTVTATDPGVSTAVAVETGAALFRGTAATVSAVTATVDGFAFDITNPDAGADYSVVASAGTVTLSGTTITVSGLTPGEASVVTVTVAKTGHVSMATAVTASALQTGITPVFGAATRTIDGYDFAITNFDALAGYGFVVPGGTASLSGDVVTVTGLAPSATAEVTVTVTRPGFTDAVATQSGSALAAGTAPVFSAVTATADGFTFTISNYDAGLVYSSVLDPASGVVVIATDGTGVVSGEAPGVAVTLAVTATDPGVSAAVASTGATVLLPGAAPILSASTPLAGGYRFTISNYDAGVNYSFAQSVGGTVLRSGDTVTVSGVGAGLFSETVVTASSAGRTSESATAGGTSFPSGSAPTISAVTRTDDGFVFTIGLLPSTTYRVSSDAGTVTLVGSTVTVTGLGAGASTTVHITASVPGVLDETTDVAGTAIANGVAPVLSSPTAARGGFVTTIANYSAAVSYRLASSAGTVTRSGARITVTGLAAGASATVTITAGRGGYHDAAASVTGRASSPEPAAPPASPSAPIPDAPSVTTTPIAGGTSAVPQGLTDSAPGSGSATAGGSSVASHLHGAGSTVTLSTDSGQAFTVAARRGVQNLPIGADGVVEVVRGGQVWITVSGLAPGSGITLWSRSESARLASGTTDVAGHTAQLVLLPASLKPGAHTLIVTGVDAAGKPVTLQMGIRVLDARTVSAVTPDDSWWWLLIVLAILLLLAGWFLVARRRRRRDDRTA
ncbi:fibronectin type III domain-containing protein [Lysinimonas soli]|uniref:Fibronectin type III domain-containing protein n=1 Tax=Lysinimonas soli TaxID=1074233 RepID=A0ABW0NPE9_9MICO